MGKAHKGFDSRKCFFRAKYLEGQKKWSKPITERAELEALRQACKVPCPDSQRTIARIRWSAIGFYRTIGERNQSGAVHVYTALQDADESQSGTLGPRLMSNVDSFRLYVKPCGHEEV